MLSVTALEKRFMFQNEVHLNHTKYFMAQTFNIDKSEFIWLMLSLIAWKTLEIVPSSRKNARIHLSLAWKKERCWMNDWLYGRCYILWPQTAWKSLRILLPIFEWCMMWRIKNHNHYFCNPPINCDVCHLVGTIFRLKKRRDALRSAFQIKIHISQRRS